MLALGIVLFGVLSRFAVHPPGFTPVLALALFGGMYLRREQAFYIPIIFMMITDVVLGLHDTIAFTWGSLLLITWMGIALRGRKNFWGVLGASLVAAILFFVVTNFGSWLSMYPATPAGFAACYAAAVPFFKITLLSTVFYSVLFWAVFELAARAVRPTRWAAVLLN